MRGVGGSLPAMSLCCSATRSHPPRLPCPHCTQDAACLRLDDGGAWRSDGIELASLSGGTAHCTLSATATQNLVWDGKVVAQLGRD